MRGECRLVLVGGRGMRWRSRGGGRGGERWGVGREVGKGKKSFEDVGCGGVGV